MKKTITFIALLCLSIAAFGQATVKINSIPNWYTPIRDTIFISGTMNNWNASDPNYRMIPNVDGTYSISINATTGSTVEYKFTRNGWNTVETLMDGTDISNRSFVFANGITINNDIENWKDMLGWHTAVGNTKILDLDFYIPQLNKSRRVWIYFPTDYFTTTTTRYPVLYMHDGQNLFDNIYAPYGEWSIDETMDSLANGFFPKAIVVGIDHGGNDRLNEYSPWVNTSYGGGEGEAYISFICNTLKPLIDNNFRTYPDRNNTGIMGSSMGGLISFCAAVKRQDIFSKVGVFSPSFWFSDSIYSYIQTQGHQQNMKIYFMSGANEDVDMVSDMQHVYNTLLTCGFNASELDFVTKTDGQHSEWFWSREYPAAYEWLFAGTGTTIENTDVSDPKVKVNYNNQLQQLYVLSNGNKPYIVNIYNITGQEIFNKKCSGNFNISTNIFSKGLYLLHIQQVENSISKKILID